MKIIKNKKIYINGLIFALTIYFYISSLIAIRFLCKYSFPDIKTIEPENYTPNLSRLSYFSHSGDFKSISNKKFHVTINNFGSRNLFEINRSGDDNVVLLGDSFFLGEGLNDDQTISYFLNKICGKNKYINLATINANINDSVANYFSKWVNMSPPKVIIFQILLINDICASSLIQEKLHKIIETDHKYFIPPFNSIFTKKTLMQYYSNKVYEEIFKDLSEERFFKYIQDPLSNLASSSKKTKIIILSYTTNQRFENYNRKLEKYCLDNGMYFYHIDELLEKRYGNSIISKENSHPSAEFNERLAHKILALEIFTAQPSR
ncbi:MAG: hypothetical protein ABII88_03395 [Candidatus Omnitrophota bacterium]